jgi:hypothetical protein
VRVCCAESEGSRQFAYIPFIDVLRSWVVSGRHYLYAASVTFVSLEKPLEVALISLGVEHPCRPLALFNLSQICECLRWKGSAGLLVAPYTRRVEILWVAIEEPIGNGLLR